MQQARGVDAYLRVQAAELAGSTPDELREAMASLLSPVDSAALTGDVIEHMHATMTEALAAGSRVGRRVGGGLRTVGVRRGVIDLPVRIWHGQHDRLFRWHMGGGCQRIPGAQFDLRPDDGHVSLI